MFVIKMSLFIPLHQWVFLTFDKLAYNIPCARTQHTHTHIYIYILIIVIPCICIGAVFNNNHNYIDNIYEIFSN